MKVSPFCFEVKILNLDFFKSSFKNLKSCGNIYLHKLKFCNNIYLCLDKVILVNISGKGGTYDRQ